VVFFCLGIPLRIPFFYLPEGSAQNLVVFVDSDSAFSYLTHNKTMVI